MQTWKVNQPIWDNRIRSYATLEDNRTCWNKKKPLYDRHQNGSDTFTLLVFTASTWSSHLHTFQLRAAIPWHLHAESSGHPSARWTRRTMGAKFVQSFQSKHVSERSSFRYDMFQHRCFQFKSQSREQGDDMFEMPTRYSDGVPPPLVHMSLPLVGILHGSAG